MTKYDSMRIGFGVFLSTRGLPEFRKRELRVCPGPSTDDLGLQSLLRKVIQEIEKTCYDGRGSIPRLVQGTLAVRVKHERSASAGGLARSEGRFYHQSIVG